MIVQSKSPDPIVLYNDFCHPGQDPPPFIQLAKRLLSVSANSASCERLFSVFSNILTKLRNRLGMENMNMLAELKMHVRDEHSRKQTKVRLKRVFQVRTDAEKAAIERVASLERTSAVDITPEPPSSNIMTVVSVQQQIPALATDATVWMEDAATETSEPNEGGDNTISGDSQSTRNNDSSFRSIAERQAQLADEDDLDCMPVRESTIGHVSINTLFDFSRTHWIEIYSRSSMRSFDEELELYKMLDMDAEGEEDEVDINVDNDTGDLLMA
jgi:hypothetical protein